ncbi:PA14 domain-containing protein [Streptomyces sp. MA5143a]|uniref:PA14 domain-containing protein n=1 Tax=Streptomyces sp. MA5143a TaxID=2083010 RepID=UPI000D26754D|nr:PA14 domain-containing protein [Streptomyces sp. MA5143a]SPF05960.1 PA14 domain protein [Streptomyces sp. MA5143a]
MATVIAAAMGGVYALTAEAAVTCAPSVFKRQMFANTSFSGTPLATDCDSAIAQDWGMDAPAPGLPDDRFGVRWSATRDFGSGGPFTLIASGRDGGVRVYVDGRLRIDLRGDVRGDVPTPGAAAVLSPGATAVPAPVPAPVPTYGPTPVSKSVDVTVPPGRHTLRVDYVNRSGAAEVAFTAVPLSGTGTVIPPSPR